MTVIEISNDKHSSTHTIEMLKLSVDIEVNVLSHVDVFEGDDYTPRQVTRVIDNDEISILAIFDENGKVAIISERKEKNLLKKITDEILYN